MIDKITTALTHEVMKIMYKTFGVFCLLITITLIMSYFFPIH